MESILIGIARRYDQRATHRDVHEPAVGARRRPRRRPARWDGHGLSAAEARPEREDGEHGERDPGTFPHGVLLQTARRAVYRAASASGK